MIIKDERSLIPLPHISVTPSYLFMMFYFFFLFFLSFFLSFVLSFFRSFFLSFFRSFVLSFFLPVLTPNKVRALDLAPTAGEFLAQCVQPPPRRAVTAAVENLVSIGALREEREHWKEEKEKKKKKKKEREGRKEGRKRGEQGAVVEALCPLGRHLAEIPCDVRIGKVRKKKKKKEPKNERGVA